MPYTETPWGSGYPWYEVVSDLTSINKEYHFKNLPKNWQDDWQKYLRDYGWLPVDPHGEYWQIPESPIVMSPLVKSVFTEGAIEGTGATALIEAGSPVIDVTFTEVGETATATVTTAGAVSATSSAVATAAAGAAIGFGVGVGSFELAPEFWTKVSNAVFGTDLEPEEIGQMTRDTNALVVIKDGLVYMAQDMVEAIRNAFFDNGADGVTIDFPDYPSTSTFEVTSYSGTLRSFLNDLEPDILNLEMWQVDINNTMLDLEGVISGRMTYTQGKDRWWGEFTVYDGTMNVPQSSPVFGRQCDITIAKGKQYTLTFDTLYNKRPMATVTAELENFNGRVYIGYRRTDTGNIEQTFSNLNAKEKAYVDGITPDGTQGTKDQPLSVVFPDWVSKGIETIAGDGKSKVKWLPVSIPNTDPLINGNPFTGDQARVGTFPDDYTENATKLGEQIQEKTKDFPATPTPPIPSVPDITPTPDDPSLIGGGGSLTGLANLYNPTLNQVKLFSRWLWGSDGLNLDQLKKLLQDPMQAIIGLHVMYATPTTGANRDIQVGYINSGVQSKIVTEQYTEIDCGTVTINEYFGDARDYTPFTQVYCYLPFIGIVELNADDVVNSTLGIKYKIDVLTGCCLAQLTVKKYGLDAVLYTYTGNCAVQMPITSGNYLSTVSSLLGAVVSGAAAVATGGALAPVAIGAAANAMGGGARASVAMSGSLGSNAGAMGIRKPYLIIKRVESADANGYNEFYGYPTNKRVNLSQLTGYVRVKEINLSGTNATEDEQNEIVSLLKEGVIL